MKKDTKMVKLQKANVPKGYMRITARSSEYDNGKFFIDAMVENRICADLIMFIKALPKSKVGSKNN